MRLGKRGRQDHNSTFERFEPFGTAFFSAESLGQLSPIYKATGIPTILWHLAVLASRQTTLTTASVQDLSRICPGSVQSSVRLSSVCPASCPGCQPASIKKTWGCCGILSEPQSKRMKRPEFPKTILAPRDILPNYEEGN